MKFAVASDSNSLHGKISKRFWHANFYLIVNEDGLNFETVKNPGNDDHSIIETIATKDIEAFIVGNIGPNAFEIMKSLNIKIMLARNLTVHEAIEKFKCNELEILNSPTLKKSLHEKRKSNKK